MKKKITKRNSRRQKKSAPIKLTVLQTIGNNGLLLRFFYGPIPAPCKKCSRPNCLCGSVYDLKYIRKELSSLNEAREAADTIAANQFDPDLQKAYILEKMLAVSVFHYN